MDTLAVIVLRIRQIIFKNLGVSRIAGSRSPKKQSKKAAEPSLSRPLFAI